MKLKLTVLFIGITAFASVSAYDVSTEVQKKNILLEVFTGIHCGNCPDGDIYTDNLLTVQPEHVFAIDIHAGYYAVPNAGQPDYRIDEGEAIDVEMENNYGYPGAAINRRLFPDATQLILARSEWMKRSKSIHSEDAPVNLHLSSVFDGSTRELRVRVEGYYTQPLEQDEIFLNVALIQDNIYGYQSGAANSPNYNHRHTLRAFLTQLWGDTIAAPEQGSYFSREYTWQVPEAIRDIPVKAEDLEVIAFVAADKMEVLNVTGKKPEYIQYDKPLAATLLAPKPAITSRYGYDFFDVRLESKSDRAITSATFKVTVNGGEQIANWAGEIASFHTLPLRLTVEPYNVVSTHNEYEIQLLTLNGESVSGNVLQGSFDAPMAATPKIILELKTDLYADENTFTIKNRRGEVVHEFGPYPPGESATYKDSVYLDPSESYCFEITDSWGDGMTTNPRSYYKLYKDGYSLLAQVYEVKVFGDKYFFRTTLPPVPTALSPVEQAKTNAFLSSDRRKLNVVFPAESNEPAEINLYSIDGKNLLTRQIVATEGVFATSLSLPPLPPGIYLICITQKDKKEVIKLKI